MNDILYFVFSNAGYGCTVRSSHEDPKEAVAKAGRLIKKGHTEVQIMDAKVIGVKDAE